MGSGPALTAGEFCPAEREIKRALLFRSEVTLHESDVGGLLKKAIKRIEAATGAKVSVQKKDERRGAKVPILFEGASKDCVDRALELLKIDVLEAGAAKVADLLGADPPTEA